MPVVTKTFAFVSDTEGYQPVVSSSSVQMAWNSTGNPSGSLRAFTSSKGVSATENYWEYTGTWESLGVPAGSLVSSVRLVSASTRCVSRSNHAQTTTIGPYRLANSAGTAIGTLWSGRTATSAESTWTNTAAQPPITIPADQQASNSTIRIQLADTIATGGGGGTPSVALHDDQVSLEITYTTPSPPVLITASDTASLSLQPSERAIKPGELIWSDEFDGTAGALPDSRFWTPIEASGPSINANNELQYYTSRPANIQLNGTGQLAITALSESYGGMSYTSGRIHSKHKITTMYGRIESRIKVPAGSGLWPAFWLMADEEIYGQWPRNGEIDIMESTNDMLYVGGATHAPTVSNPAVEWVSETRWTPGGGLSGDYHIFAVEWEPDAIHWLMDGVRYKTLRRSDVNETVNQWAFNNRQFYVILNMAVGGTMPGNPVGTSQFPATMLVDYVRLYQREATPYSSANPKASALVTDFTDYREFNNWDALRTLTSGRLNITLNNTYPAIVSQRRFDLTQSSVFAELVQPPNVGSGSTQTALQVLTPAGKKIEFGWTNNAMYLGEDINGAATTEYPAWVAGTHKYFRIRHTDGTVFWETSADATTWTIQRAVATTADLSNVQVAIIAGHWNTEASPGVAIWDNLNVVPQATVVNKSASDTTGLRSAESSIPLYTDNFDGVDLGKYWINTAPTTGSTASGGVVVGGTAANAVRYYKPSTGLQVSEATYLGGSFIGVTVAMPTFTSSSTLADAGTWYIFRQQGSGNGVHLAQKNLGSGAHTTLISSATNLVAGDRIRVEWDGVELRGYINGTLVLSNTPASPITNQPYVGWAHGSSAQSGTQLLDNWTGGRVYNGPAVYTTIPKQIDFPFASDVTPTGWNDDPYHQFFGMRDSGTRTHRAVDMMVPDGTPVYSVCDGVIDSYMPGISEPMSTVGGGYQLRVNTADNLRYVYAHFGPDTPGVPEQAFAPGIVPGATVTKGQLLGWAGNSGTAESGPHIHFEIRDLAGVVHDDPAADYSITLGLEDAPRYDPYPSLIDAQNRKPAPTSSDVVKTGSDSATVSTLEFATTFISSQISDGAGLRAADTATTLVSISTSDSISLSIYDTATTNISSTTGVLVQTGSLRTIIDDAYASSVDSGTEGYVVPTTVDLSGMQSIWNDIMAGSLSTAATSADTYGYDIINLNDTETNRNFYVLRERAVNGVVPKGWGTYVWSPNTTSKTIYETPHIKFDMYVTDQGLESFLQENALAFFMGGSHRKANSQQVGGVDVADVANVTDPPSSVFQYIHEASDNLTDRFFIQYHGFGTGNAEPTGGVLYRSGSDATTGDVAVNSLTINTPSGIQTGDRMFAVVAVRGDTNVITDPAGWTRVNPAGANANGSMNDGTLLQAVLYQRIVDGTESNSYTWTWGTASRAVIQMVAYQGVAGIDVVATGIETGSSVTSHTTPTVTSTNPNSVPVYMIYGASNSFYTTNISGDFRRFQTNTGSTSPVNGGWYDSGYPEAAGAHSKTISSSLGFSTGVMFIMYLAPTNTPVPTDIVLSHGDNTIPAKMSELATVYRNAGYTARENPGDFAWTAQENVQGIYSRTGTSNWIHVEQVTEVRVDPTTRYHIADLTAGMPKSASTIVSKVSSDNSSISSLESSNVSLFSQRADSSGLRATDTATTRVSVTASDGTGLRVSDAAAIYSARSATDIVSTAVSENANIAAQQPSLDNGSLSAVDTSTTFISSSSSDTAVVSVGDSAVASSYSSRTENASIGISESTSVLVNINRTDGTGLRSTEAVTRTRSFGSTDNVSISASEAAAASNTTTPAQDFATIGAVEQSAVEVFISTADAPVIVVDDLAAPGVSNSSIDFLATGLIEQVVTEVGQPAVDAASLAVVESSATFKALTSDDIAGISANEVSGIGSTLPTIDEINVAITEEAANNIEQPTQDAVAISVSESSIIHNAPVASDNLNIVSVDSAQIFKALSSSDASSLSLTESSAAFISKQSNDTITISVSDASLRGKSLASSDTVAISVGDTHTKFARIFVSDSTSISTVENVASFGTTDGSESTTLAANETTARSRTDVRGDIGGIGVIEISSTDVFVQATDNGSLAVSGSSTSFKVLISDEYVAVNVEDIQGLNKPIDAQDSAAIGLTDESETFKSIVASDESTISASDELLFGREIDGVEVFSVTLTENIAIRVTLDADDEQIISVAESNEGYSETNSADVIPVIVIDEGYVGGNDLGATDDVTLNVSEAALVTFIGHNSHDESSVAVNEISNTNTQQPSLDSASVGVTDESSIFITLTSNDASAIEIFDYASTTVEISAADQGALGVVSEATLFRGITSTDQAIVEINETNQLYVHKFIQDSDSSSLLIVDTHGHSLRDFFARDISSIAVIEDSAQVRSISTSDTVGVGIQEATNFNISLESSDATGLRISTATTSNRGIGVSDTLPVTVTESTGAFRLSTPASNDTVSVSVSDTSSVLVSFHSDENHIIGTTDTTVMYLQLNISDAINLRADEKVAFYREVYTGERIEIILTERPHGFNSVEASDNSSISIEDAGAAPRGISEIWVFLRGQWRQGVAYVYKGGKWRKTYIAYYDGEKWLTQDS